MARGREDKTMADQGLTDDASCFSRIYFSCECICLESVWEDNTTRYGICIRLLQILSTQKAL